MVEQSFGSSSFFIKRLRENSLFDTRQMTRSFFDPQKNFVPYLTPSSTFIPYMTLRWIFHPRTVNCDVKKRFCPCGPHHPSPSSPPLLLNPCMQQPTPLTPPTALRSRPFASPPRPIKGGSRTHARTLQPPRLSAWPLALPCASRRRRCRH